MISATFIQYAYIVASVLFILGLKMLSRASTAPKGNLISAIGMLIAVVATLLHSGMDYKWILIGLLAGSIIGGLAAQTVKMTSMPEMVALFNGFGGLASLLVGWAEYHRGGVAQDGFTLGAIFFSVLIGGITFTGSIIAYGKLAEKLPGRPLTYPLQNQLNIILLLATAASGFAYAYMPEVGYSIFYGIIALALVLGVLTVIPIGGGDMPVVIALLNSYSGLAASAAGFAIGNNVLIVAGALVGASGLILTDIMCRAMNRSLTNVLFGAFGGTSSGGAKVEGEAKPISAEDTYLMLEAASSVVVVPGYGMAVAQAQHVVHELGDLLEENGTEVRYAIHPVAGRMPGHMNVLLAEANVPYEQLVEPDEVNPTVEMVDVVIVIGANDVVNPSAREDETSSLYGMPIIDVDLAKTCIVLKRSMNPGFAGIANPLFVKENTRMLFGDAKASLSALVSEFKS